MQTQQPTFQNNSQTEDYYIVDKSWWDEYHLWGKDQNRHPTVNLISHSTLTGPTLRRSLQLGQHLHCLDAATWLNVRQDFSNCSQILRHKNPEGIVEGVRPIQVVACISNKTIKKFEKSLFDWRKFLNQVDFSRYDRIQLIQNDIARNLKLNSQSVRIWKTTYRSIEELANSIQPQIAQFHEIYHVNVAGQVLPPDQTIQKLGLTAIDNIIVEIFQDGLQCLYGNIVEIFSKCYTCKTNKLLTVKCKCSSKVYCSGDCLQHKMDCRFQNKTNGALMNPVSLPVPTNLHTSSTSNNGFNHFQGRKTKTSQGLRNANILSEVKPRTEQPKQKPIPSQPPRQQILMHIGLKNLGNTCFINAALQCLIHVPELSMDLIDTPLKFLNEQKRLLYEAYRQILKKIHKLNACNNQIVHFKKKLDKVYSQYIGTKQHDSQQFLGHFLDLLSEGTSEQMVNPVKRLFQGKFLSTVQCLSCLKTSETRDAFNIVSLPIPRIVKFRLILLLGLKELTYTVSCLIQQLQQIIYEKIVIDSNVEFPEGMIFFTEEKQVSFDDFWPRDTAALFIRPLTRHQNDSDRVVLIKIMQCKSTYNDENYRTEVMPKILFGYSSKRTISQFRNILLSWFLETTGLQKNSDNCYEIFVTRETKLICPVCQKATCHGCPLPNSNQIFSTYMRDTFKNLQDLGVNRVCLEFYWRGKEIITMDKKVSQKKFDDVSKVTLQRCLKEFSKPERIQEWECPECKATGEAQKTLHLDQLPQNIIFHLKRFDQGHKESTKINVPISFPIQNFSLSQFMKKPTQPYSLASACMHVGRLDYGHYTTVCKTQDGWRHFNDSIITQTVPQKFQNSETIYYMIYKQT